MTAVWDREHYQRNALRRALIDLCQDDVVLVTDCDEIVSPDGFNAMRAGDGYFMFNMTMYQFYLNMRSDRTGWTKAFAYSYRMQDRIPNYEKIRENPEAWYKHFTPTSREIAPGGWHFTFLGGADKVVEKLRAYAHQEEWQQDMLTRANEQMMFLKSVGGGSFLEFCAVDGTFPETVQRNYKSFVNRGLIKETMTRISDLEFLIAQYDHRTRMQTAALQYMQSELDRLYAIDISQANLALRKPATQSSTVRQASFGNDGCLNGRVGGCKTATQDSPWWQVDLGYEYNLHEIRISSSQSR